MSGLDKDRLRNQTVSFRVSPEERRQLEARIIISGMPKGAFIIQSLLQQEIKIVAGKFESDRLSLELKRLKEAIEHSEGEYDNDEIIIDLLKDCKAILKELQNHMFNAETELQKIDFLTVNDEPKKNKKAMD